MARAESYESEVTPTETVDPIASARAAGLRHVDDRPQGFRRRPTGIHPGVIASYLDGTLPSMFAARGRHRTSRRRRGLRTGEAAVLALLRR
jgi:hypothetical protein